MQSMRRFSSASSAASSEAHGGAAGAGAHPLASMPWPGSRTTDLGQVGAMLSDALERLAETAGRLSLTEASARNALNFFEKLTKAELKYGKAISELCEGFSRSAHSASALLAASAADSPSPQPPSPLLHDPEPELDAMWMTFVAELASATAERMTAVQALRDSAVKHLSRVAKSDMAEQMSRMSTAKRLLTELKKQQAKLEQEENKLREQLKALDEEVELTSAAYVPQSQSQAELMMPTMHEQEAAAAAVAAAEADSLNNSLDLQEADERGRAHLTSAGTLSPTQEEGEDAAVDTFLEPEETQQEAAAEASDGRKAAHRSSSSGASNTSEFKTITPERLQNRPPSLSRKSEGNFPPSNPTADGHKSNVSALRLSQDGESFTPPMLRKLARMQSPSVLQSLQRRRDLTKNFRQNLGNYQERHKHVFLTEWPALLAALTMAEQQRVAATRDCLVMYTGLSKHAPQSRPFAATLAAARDVTDGCAVACQWHGVAPPLPVYRDPSHYYDVQPVNLEGILNVEPEFFPETMPSATTAEQQT